MSTESVDDQESQHFDLYRPFEDFTVSLGTSEKIQILDENNAPIGTIFCVNSQWFFLGENSVNRRRINEAFQSLAFNVDINTEGGLDIKSNSKKLFFCIKPQNEDFKHEYKFVDFYHKIERVVLQSPKILRIMAWTPEQAILLGEIRFVSGTWIYINPNTGEEIDTAKVDFVHLGRKDSELDDTSDGTYARRAFYQTDTERNIIPGIEVFDTNYEAYFFNPDSTVSALHTIIYARPVEEVTAGRVDLGSDNGLPVLQIVDTSKNGTFVCVKDLDESFRDFPELDSCKYDLRRLVEQFNARYEDLVVEMAAEMTPIDE